MKKQNTFINFLTENKVFSVIIFVFILSISKKIFKKLKKDEIDKKAEEVSKQIATEIQSNKNFNEDAKLLINYFRPAFDLPFIGTIYKPIEINGYDEEIVNLLKSYNNREFEAIKVIYEEQSKVLRGQKYSLIEDLRNALSNSEFNSIKHIF